MTAAPGGLLAEERQRVGVLEHSRFDAMARTFSKSGTRRGTFRALVAGGLGLGALGLGMDQVEAKKKLNARCKSTDECAGKLKCKKSNPNHHWSKTQKRCCVKLGKPCQDFLDCCGINVHCDGEVCVND